MTNPILTLIEAETPEEQISAMQAAINDGSIWCMEGSMGRAAMDAITSGACMLGEIGHRDAYGNYIPSRHEVQPGTKGSREYCGAHNWGDDD